MARILPCSFPLRPWLPFVLALCAAAPALAAAPPAAFLDIVEVASGLATPVGVTHAGDGSGRLFVVEQRGRIRIVQGSQVLATPFLDLTALVGPCSPNCDERGLLGLAFHPGYETNGFFYVYYTRVDDPATLANETGDIVLARYEVSGDPGVADAGSAMVLLTIEHSSQANHNGGQLAFGPDGYLYAAVGDGGGGGDFLESGQSLATLLGKILRLDVDGGSPYAIPPDNPFAGATPGRDEVWDYGLRNPWRFSFDRETGDLYVGDVGQQVWEEIDFEPAASPGGVNYGWDCREGAHDFNDPNGDLNATCPDSGFTDPVLEYDHTLGCSVTGGFVFRGLPQGLLTGEYVYGDFCSGRIWAGSNRPGGWTSEVIENAGFGVSSFGESEAGGLFFTNRSTGGLHRLAPYTFSDVHPGRSTWPFVEALAAAGVTAGCGPQAYCPTAVVTREQMAVFLLVAREGPGYTPPPCTTPTFADVACSSPYARWIGELVVRGVTAGCGGGNYCPTQPVTREEMAVFLLRTLAGSGYAPPPCTSPVFADVPCSSSFAPWINELAARGIAAGCRPGEYCPGAAVTREQMAVFLTATFDLTTP